MRKSLGLALSVTAVVGAVLAPVAASAATGSPVAQLHARHGHRLAGDPAPSASPAPVPSASTAPAPSASPAPVPSASTAAPGSDPDTTVTFAVTSGLLTITAPIASDLGSGAPGGTISGALGAVTVTDNRALLSASWTATASSTNWTTGTATPAETIPASDANYDPGPVATTGTITVTPTDITLSNSPQTVVSASAGTGDNTASWDPTVSVVVPAAAVTGTYTATLTHSVT
jgi:hypothetical protein